MTNTATQNQPTQQYNHTPSDTRLCNPHNLFFIQSRAEMNFEAVDEYKEMMERKMTFDPAEGLEDGRGQIHVWDGFHRGEAAKASGTMLLVHIQSGTKADAEWKAFSANIKHGLRRTRKDIERVVKNALRHPNGVSLPDREIARHCGCDHKTVGKYRQELETSGEIPQIEKRDIRRGDQSYQIEVPGAEAYFTVIELEQVIREYLHGNRKERINYLQHIIQNTEAGKAYLREIEGSLKGEKKWRKAYIMKAVKNLRDGLTQIHCSGTQENEQPCDFVGSDAQMYEHNGKYYCARCFGKIQQAQKEPPPAGDVSVLDTHILKIYAGVGDDYKADIIKKAIFSDEILQNLAERIPGFPPAAIRERCKILYDRLSPKKAQTPQEPETQKPEPTSSDITETEPEAEQQHPTVIAATIEELEKELAENWWYIEHNIEHNPENALKSLRAIRDRSKSGQFVLSNIYNQLKDAGKILPGQKKDIRFACWNLLERLEAAQSGEEQSAQPADTKTAAIAIGEQQAFEEVYNHVYSRTPASDEAIKIVFCTANDRRHEIRMLNEKIEKLEKAPVAANVVGNDLDAFCEALRNDNTLEPELLRGLVNKSHLTHGEKAIATAIMNYIEANVLAVASETGKPKPPVTEANVLAVAVDIRKFSSRGTVEQALAELDEHDPHETTEQQGTTEPKPIDATEAAAILAEDRIIQLKQEGMAVRSITQKLKEEHILNEKGKPWSKSAVDRVIQQARGEGIEV